MIAIKEKNIHYLTIVVSGFGMIFGFEILDNKGQEKWLHKYCDDHENIKSEHKKLLRIH